MTFNKAQSGFTLLELLLVVGIAAILIIAGITTYSLVNKSRKVNETVTLLNTLIGQTRKLHETTKNYGMGGALEPLLYNTGNIPEKYKLSDVTSHITNPFDRTTAAIAIVGSGDSFVIFVNMPHAYVPEIAQNFNPARRKEINTVQICGSSPINATNAATMMEPAAMAAQCGSGTDLPEGSGALMFSVK